RISAAYAELAKKDPSFIWAGTAAGGSNLVGETMSRLRTQWRDLKANNKDVFIEEKMFNLLAKGNKAVYDDLYWQHLAFADGGIELMRKFAKQKKITPEHLKGWEKVHEGREMFRKAG